MHVSRAVLAHVAGALLVSACAHFGATGRIEGAVLLGAACGTVPIAPHARSCDPRPIATRLAVKAADGRELPSLDTDAEGRFAIQLPPGRYELRAPERPGFAPASTVVDVRAGEQSSVNLVYPALAP